MIKTLAACLAALSLAACTVPVQRTASGEVPPARIYIKSMTEENTAFTQVTFRRDDGMLNNQMLELSINDVVLAQVAGGEHLVIWLKPGSYDFSVKPAAALNAPAYGGRNRLTLPVQTGKAHKVRIGADVRGVILSAEP